MKKLCSLIILFLAFSAIVVAQTEPIDVDAVINFIDFTEDPPEIGLPLALDYEYAIYRDDPFAGGSSEIEVSLDFTIITPYGSDSYTECCVALQQGEFATDTIEFIPYSYGDYEISIDIQAVDPIYNDIFPENNLFVFNFDIPNESACIYDLNGDDEVDSLDIGVITSLWGSTADIAADIDNNGAVDIDDLVSVILNWGEC